MLRSLITTFARRKNPAFELDPAVSSQVIGSFAWRQFWAWFRGLRFWLYGRKPQMLFLGRGVRFQAVSNLKLGRMVRIQEHCWVNALGKGKLKIGDQVTIGAYSRLSISYSLSDLGAHIHIGNNVGIGEYAHLGGAGGLEIGEDCIIGPYFSCHPENHVYDQVGVPFRHQGVTRAGIKIGKNCWVGAKVTLLDGVTIGDNCILAAGAVVTHSFPNNCIIGGVPAKILKPLHQPQTS